MLSKKIYKNDESLLTWGGHSTFLFQKKNVNVLIDPHFTSKSLTIFLYWTKTIYAIRIQ